MKRVFKVLFVLVLVFASVAIVSACDEDDGRQVINFYQPFGGPSELEKLTELVEMYNESQEIYRVNMIFIPDVQTRLQTSIAGNRAPDVVYFEGFSVQQWASHDMFYDLTEMAARDGLTRDIFYDYVWDESVYNDRLWAVPLTADNRMLFWNKGMFRDAGLDPERPPRTIAELDEFSRILTTESADGRALETVGFVPWLEMGGLVTFGFAFGGNLQDPVTGELTPDDPKIVEALEWMMQYVEMLRLARLSTFLSGMAQEISMISSGQVGMTITGSWMLSLLDEIEGLEYGIAPIPTPSGEDNVTWGGGFSLIIPHNARNVDGAWDFIKYATVGEGAELASKYRTMFASAREFNEGWVEYDERYQVFIDALETARSRPQFSANLYYMSQMHDATERFLRNQGSAKDLLVRVRENTIAHMEDANAPLTSPTESNNTGEDD